MFYIIYETLNIINGMKYRGCHITQNLDDDYLGSGVLIRKAIIKYGKENFQRKIIYLCSSLEEMIEKESYFVNEEWVKREDTYNLQTGGLSYGILSEQSKDKISKSVSLAHKNGVYDYSVLKGKPAWNAGLKNPYSEETIDKMKKSKIGFVPWNKGITGKQSAWNKNMKMKPMKDETKKKISETLKERYEKEEHHLKGKEAHNKGKKTGKPSWNSGIKFEKAIICPFCGTKGASNANMQRWHFNNCKQKSFVD